MRSGHAALVTFRLAVLCSVAGVAQAERYEIVAGKPNLVRFESKAPLESFEGKTHQVQGHIVFSPDSLATMAVHVEVDLASLDTGIALRNKHMRQNHLHTDEFPKALFRGGTVSALGATALRVGASVSFEIQGVFELHGVEKPVAAQVDMTRDEAGLQITARFSVRLADFGIPRPKFLVMQLDEVQRVTAALVAVPAAEPGP